MQRRPYNRIPSRLKVRLLRGNKVCPGTVTDLSEKSMFIHADINSPFDSKFEVDIPLKEKSPKLPVRVSRLVKKKKYYDTMAVVVVNLQKDYLEFVNSLTPVNKSENSSGQIR